MQRMSGSYLLGSAKGTAWESYSPEMRSFSLPPTCCRRSSFSLQLQTQLLILKTLFATSQEFQMTSMSGWKKYEMFSIWFWAKCQERKPITIIIIQRKS